MDNYFHHVSLYKLSSVISGNICLLMVSIKHVLQNDPHGLIK